MTDPAHIAEMDQVQAAYRTWAECLRICWQQLMIQGIPQDTALDIARDWVGTIVQKLVDADE